MYGNDVNLGGFFGLFGKKNKNSQDDDIHPSRLTIQHHYKIEYMTDLEGNWEYFKRLVNESKIIKFKDKDQPLTGLNWEEKYTKNGYFVHGGDVCDQGVGDMRIVWILLDFQKENEVINCC